MSDKKSLLEKEQHALDTARAKFEHKKSIIEALPDGAPVPEMIITSGYCAEASLFYESGRDLAVLLKAMPPLPCVYIRGSSVTVKPEQSLREEDAGWRRSIFPLVLAAQSRESVPSRAQWWTSLAGRSTQVHVAGVSAGDVEATDTFKAEAHRYTPSGYAYATGSVQLWLLRQRTESDLPALTPVQLWAQQGRAPDAELAALTESCMARAQAWIEQFFAKHGNPFEKGGGLEMHPAGHPALRYLFRKETGLAGNINWVHGKSHGYEIGYTLDKAHIRVRRDYDSALPVINWASLAEYF